MSILALPKDVLYYLAFFMDVGDICKLSCMCKQLYEAFGDDANKKFWRWKGYFLGIVPKGSIVGNAKYRCVGYAIYVKRMNKGEYYELEEIRRWAAEKQPYASYAEARADIAQQLGVFETPDGYGNPNGWGGPWCHIDIHDPRIGMPGEIVHTDNLQNLQLSHLKRCIEYGSDSDSDSDVNLNESNTQGYTERWRRDEAILWRAFGGVIPDDESIYIDIEYDKKPLEHPHTHLVKKWRNDMALEMYKNIEFLQRPRINSMLFRELDTDSDQFRHVRSIIRDESDNAQYNAHLDDLRYLDLALLEPSDKSEDAYAYLDLAVDIEPTILLNEWDLLEMNSISLSDYASIPKDF